MHILSTVVEVFFCLCVLLDSQKKIFIFSLSFVVYNIETSINHPLPKIDIHGTKGGMAMKW